MMKLRHRSLATPPTWICIQCRANSSITSRSSSPPSVRTRSNNGTNKRAVPDKPARTRFAPSPTGYLHLGSLRTALFNYLLARRTGGQFLLRIEDTDQKRTIPGAEERLYSDLQWAGLEWDEGPIVGGPFGPYRQSERTSIYHKHANDLVHSGHAYRCFCSAERLDTLARQRNEAGLPLGYDRQCTDISTDEAEERAANGETHVIRLKADGYPKFNDFVFGTTGQNLDGQKQHWKTINRVYDDPILLKSDGNPTYHLANVVDDHNMKITHVIRGTEWLASTPMHVALYEAFEWAPPQFGHVPLLVDQNGQKLSKRNGNIDISFYRDSGILPSTLVNYAALLGWSHTSRSEVFSLKDMEEIFTLKITKGNAIVSPEKMWFLQKAHTKRCVAENGPEFKQLLDDVVRAAAEIGIIKDDTSHRATITALLRADAKSYTTPKEFLSRNHAFFKTDLERPAYTPVSVDTEGQKIQVPALHTVATILTLVPESQWNTETHRVNLATCDYSSASEGSAPGSEKAFKKELYHYLRWALLAGSSGPGIPETMAILGKAETVRRLNDAKMLTRRKWSGKSAPTLGSVL